MTGSADGIGRALFDKIRLPSQPGPHQRCSVLAATDQLPITAPIMLSSKRTSSVSWAESTHCALRSALNQLPIQLMPAETSARPRGVSWNERMRVALSATPTLVSNVSSLVRVSQFARDFTRTRASTTSGGTALASTLSMSLRMGPQASGHVVVVPLITPAAARR
jgi:hypothetical protein